MAEFSNEIRKGTWRGYSGLPIKNIVNIGIGGSDLGPVMAYEALREYSNRDINFRFVSNVDGTDFYEATRDLDPAETLFVISSKTFTTLETMTNAQTARRWFLQRAHDDQKAVAKHFVAVSTNVEEVTKFGIDKRNIFEFWDWVGGRYSMDSAIGLSTMIAVGSDNFRAMLAGLHAMDEHFRTAPFERNLPVIMGLLTVWYSDFFGARRWPCFRTTSISSVFPHICSSSRWRATASRSRSMGSAVDYQTSPIFWGEPGTNGQHSFYQLIHQGTKLIPCDFIGFASPLNNLREHHDILIANMLAQSEAPRVR